MSSVTKLQQMIDGWTSEVESFCVEANETLDELEAYGKEPVLDDTWLEDLASSDESFYFSTDSLKDEGELESEEKHRQLRPMEEQSFASSDAIASVLELAHAENIDSWQQVIASAMAG